MERALWSAVSGMRAQDLMLDNVANNLANVNTVGYKNSRVNFQDLLYSALGDYAVGIPSLAGLYFNVFHPLIQTFIFITLTLTFINEAIE